MLSFVTWSEGGAAIPIVPEPSAAVADSDGLAAALTPEWVALTEECRARLLSGAAALSVGDRRVTVRGELQVRGAAIAV